MPGGDSGPGKDPEALVVWNKRMAWGLNTWPSKHSCPSPEFQEALLWDWSPSPFSVATADGHRLGVLLSRQANFSEVLSGTGITKHKSELCVTKTRPRIRNSGKGMERWLSGYEPDSSSSRTRV